MYKWLICGVVALFMGFLTGCFSNTVRGAGQFIQGIGTDVVQSCDNADSY